MKKVVLKLEFYDDEVKQEAMQKVAGLVGIESVAIDNKYKILTVVGDIDPVKMVSKLRELCHTDIVSVGPAKEKDESQKKDEGNKKDDLRKGGDEKKGGGGGGGGDNKKYESKLPHHLPVYHQNCQPGEEVCMHIVQAVP
nr:heavy metal-associated isoprenylated plant protein 39-like [Coffea arabica]